MAELKREKAQQGMLRAGEKPTFVPGADPTFDKTPGAVGVIHSMEQEEAIRRKAASGRTISQEDL